MNKDNSIFGQILSLFPRLKFEAFVQETHSAKRIKGSDRKFDFLIGNLILPGS